MSRIYRRQRQLYLFTGLVVTFALVNVLFYLILHRPARSEYIQLRDSITRLKSEKSVRQTGVDQREKVSLEIQTSERDRRALFEKHFIAHDVGFAAVLPEIDSFVQKSGVKWTRVDSGKEELPKYGLFSVRIKLPVQGPYANIVNFIREIENSRTFYIIDSIDVRGMETSSSPGQVLNASPAGNVSLSVNLETFFYQ